MAKFHEGVVAGMKQLSKVLTLNDIAKLQVSLAVPSRIIEAVKASSNPGSEFLLQLKKWDEFNPVEFMQVIEEMNNRELLSLAKKIPWLNVSAIQQVTTERKTAHTFINLLRDIAADDWKLIAHNITESGDTEQILNCCIQVGIIAKDLTVLCKAMSEIERNDLVPKIQNYAALFEGLSEEEFKNKLLSEIEFEEEDNHPQWKRKLREYMLLQHRDVSVILDKETVALKSVYTPLTVIDEESERVKPEEETTIKEIEFLKKMTKDKRFGGRDDSDDSVSDDSDSDGEMNKCTRSGMVDFESHISYCRTEKPEVWTLIGNPGCGKTFLCKYAGYNYGIENIENFQYLLCIPCRDTEWHAIEVARQEDKEINKFIRRWLHISLPLGAGWAESLSRYLMRSGGESLLLIIDGLDEFIKTVPFDTTLLYLLLQKRILPSATVLLTSRPGAWYIISNQFRGQFKVNSHYQVLGFSPENRDSYFKRRMINESKLVDTHKLFNRHEELSLLALVPVNASLFSALFNDTADILAQTITDVYQALITYMVKRQLSRMGLREYTKVSHFHSLSPVIQECIEVIGEQAYSGIYDRELVCKDDVTLCLGEKEFLCERLGLMQEHFVVDKLVGRIKVWVYAHLTLQEFVSSMWLSYQKWTEQCMITRYLVSSDELFYMFKMVIRFVCGILCDKAAAMLAILCKKLFPRTIQQMPMFYQLGYDSHSGYSGHNMIILSNWEEFSRLFLELVPIIIESKPGSSHLNYVKQIIPAPLHLYFESVISPNDWYTFLQSLPYLPHIQIIYIHTKYISTEQFRSLITRIHQCSLNYLALTFYNTDSSTILSYTSIISNMPANIKISIELYRCYNISDSDILFPTSANQFTWSLGIHNTKLSQRRINNLFSKFSSIQYFYYYTNTKPDWSLQKLIELYKPTNGLYIREEEEIGISYDISPDIFPHFSSLQEIHLEIEDPYSVLPYIQSFFNLTYLGIRPTDFQPVYRAYGDILKHIINRNTNTLRGIKLDYLDSIGIYSWDSILAPIQYCSKLIDLDIRGMITQANAFISTNTTVDYLQSLVRLYLHFISLSSTEVYTLCDGLAYNPVIKEITIELCKLDSTSCIHFIHLIPTLLQLEKLNVARNNLNSPDPSQIAILLQTAKEYSVYCYT